MTKANVEDIYPLSPLQEGLLFQSLYDADSTAYTLQVTLRLAGGVRAEWVAESWRYLCQRHAVLRSAFMHEGLARPLQVVLKAREPEFSHSDLSALPPEAQQAAIAAHQAQERARGFDLEKEVLLRLALFRVGPEEAILVWSYHHILLDGWCLGILQQEFMQVYAALREGKPPQLPPVPPYRDYIRWLERRDQAKSRAYWAATLEGFEEVVGYPRLAVSEAGGYALAERVLEVDEATTARLRQLATRLGATLNTLMQAVWALLLARYNSAEDVVLGVVVSGRPSELRGVEEMVGLFINTLPLRLRVEPTQPFAEFVRAAQRTALEMEPHHYFPLAEIQAQAGLGSLFDHVVVFENYPYDEASAEASASASGFRMEGLSAYDQTHYDVDLTLVPGRTLLVKVSFNAHVYAPDQVARTLAHLHSALHSILAAPEQPVGEVTILPPEERETLLVTFNDTAMAYPAHTPLHELFEAQVVAGPERVAAEHNGQILTYAALNERANRIAHLLRRTGLTRNGFVGLLVERGLDCLAAMVGILKAGGAFVPIDPSYPAERVAYMVANSQIQHLISQQGPLARGEWLAGVAMRTLLVLDGPPLALPDLATFGPDDLAQEATSNPDPVNQAEDRAYMLYTSGSTGLPKGAIIRHNGAVNHIFGQFQALAFHAESAFLQSAPSSSDISVWQFLAPLLCGGRTVIADLETVASPAALLALLRARRVTLIELVPVVLKALLDHAVTLPPAERALDALEWAMVTGEAVSVPLVNQWLRQYPMIRLVNAYGPTEAADDICQAVIDTPLPATLPNVPIGKPLGNLSLYVLDPALRLLPIGVPGEIAVAGIGVGEGYWQNEARTRESFVPNLYARDATHATLYRTGDRGRWLPDGSLEFLGRFDHQVKIRGHRVEIGEIEAGLAQHPAVQEAVVLAQADGAGQRVLVGYLLPAPGEQPEETAIRAFLRRTLPEYMVPVAFVTVERWPLAPSGKVDRKALPPLGGALPRGERTYQPPRTDTEAKLAAIWQAILQVERVGIRDNFFDLGGHSLKAMQVVSRIQKDLGVKVGLRAFFDAPTVAEQAALVAATEATDYETIPPAPPQPHYELSHAQKRLWLQHQLDGAVAYNMPEAFRFTEGLDVPALKRAFATLVQRHEALRTAFIVVEGVPRQQIIAELPFDITEIDLRGEAEPEARARVLADAEATTPFDLSHAPLLRATLVRLGEQHSLFLLTIHHIIGDGWSGRVLYQEVLALYEAYRRGLPNPLAPLRLQYKDFAVWQNARGFAREEAYWLKKLAGVPDRIALPFDFPLQGGRDFQGSTERVALTGAVAEGLRVLARQRQTTLSNVVLALFKLFLFRLTKQADLCVGMASANRTRADLENLLGFFVNLLPIRTHLSEESDFDGLLAQVIEAAGEALEYQDYPFDLLIQHLNPRRYGNRQPVLNVVYGFQSYEDVQVEVATQPDAVVPAGGAGELERMGAFDFTFETSKFDLTLFVLDDGGQILLTLEYDTNLFAAKTIRRYLATLERFAQMVASRVGDPAGAGG